MQYDSTGVLINIGDEVRFRGQIYTIKSFILGKGRCGTSQIIFEEESHTPEIADELSVDLFRKSFSEGK